jgi:hypothetical protein
MQNESIYHLEMRFIFEMRYIAFIASLLVMTGLPANTGYAGEPGKQAEVEQSIDGAMQLFEAQRKERFATGTRVMAKVIPYLYQGPMGIDSRQVLLRRIEEVEEASRFAAAMAFMHRDLSVSLVRMLEDMGLGRGAAQARVAKVVAGLRPEQMEADFEARHLVMEALNRVYEYLDNHWGEWELHGKLVTFSDEKLNIPYQTLMDRLGETVDQMDAIRNPKANVETTTPLSCALTTRQLSEGVVEAIVTVKNLDSHAVTMPEPSVGTVTWILADNQVIGAHPGRPPEEIALAAGDSARYSDSLELPADAKILAAKLDAGKSFGVLKCD